MFNNYVPTNFGNPAVQVIPEDVEIIRRGGLPFTLLLIAKYAKPAVVVVLLLDIVTLV